MISFIFVALLALTVLLAYRGGLQIVDAIRSEMWPEVPGQVISSHVEEKTTYNDEEQTVFQAKVTYSYTVGDRKYTGSGIAIGMEGLWGSENAAKKYCADFTQGRQLYVAYDPVDPAKSVLHRGVSLKTFLPFAVGVLVLVVSTRMYLSFINELQQ